MSDETHPTNEADQSTGGRAVIRWPEVERRTQRSRTQAWRDIRAGKFPAPVRTGENSVAWFEDEIDGWLADRPRVTYGPSEAA